jgi:hypothetical protein
LGGSGFKASLGKTVCETRSQKTTVTKKWLVEWLKVKALSSNPSTKKPRSLRRSSVWASLFFIFDHLKNIYFSVIFNYFSVVGKGFGCDDPTRASVLCLWGEGRPSGPGGTLTTPSSIPDR